jgi:hypothetical protein
MKYKLIKKYPGSPELGSIEDDCDLIDKFSSMSPANYPEFWEKVYDKNYEILAFQTSFGFFIRRSNGSFVNSKCSDDFVNEKYLLDEPSREIYEVARLSDGKIFSIGSEVTFKGFYGVNWRSNSFKISGFDFRWSRSGYNNKIGAKYPNGLVDIDKLIEPSKPILSTMDDILLFEGDDVYYVETDKFNDLAWKAQKVKLQKNHVFYRDEGTDMLPFSTEEAATKWIYWNEPRYSLRDTLNLQF